MSEVTVCQEHLEPVKKAERSSLEWQVLRTEFIPRTVIM